MENSILGRSELHARSAEELIWDAYPLEKARVDSDGRIRIRIAELESDTDRLDYIGLSAVLAPAGSRIGVDEEGQAVVYRPSPVGNAVVTWTGKLQPFVSPVAPGDAYRGEPGDSMDISVGAWPGSRGKVVLHLIPKPVESSPLPGRTPGLDIRVSADESGDRWVTLDPVVPREHWSDALVSLNATTAPARRIRLVWNTKHTLGGVGIAEPLDIEGTELTPVSAVHSTLGDVLTSVRETDIEEVVLRPSEFVDLEFDGSMVPPGARLVLRAHGRYSRITKAAPAPAVFSLGKNRPNPFNPRTEIDFSLPVDSEVSLRVFDVAGRHVRQLVRGSKPAGVHTVTWDGRDEQARSLSSGIYFYELQVGSFREHHRMILLR